MNSLNHHLPGLTDNAGAIASADTGTSRGLPVPASLPPSDLGAPAAPAMLPASPVPEAQEENSGTVQMRHETPAPGLAGAPAVSKSRAESRESRADLALDPRPSALDQLATEILREDGVALPPDEWRIEEANRRQQILETYHSLVASGHSKASAAKHTGQGYATLWRWEKAFKAEGFNGLIPDTDKCGRKSTFAKLGFTPEQVEQIRNEIQGLNLDLDSVTASLRLYANSDRCPAELAAVILNPNRCSKHALPPSLRAAAKVNKNAQKAHRGPRALSLGGIYTPRRMDVLPGDVFVSDDTTPIWAWWVPWYESEEYPFGVKLLQGQFIPVMDVASQCIVSYVIIAREKSSYRAADIWHLFGHTFDTVGLPRLGFQLERGSWEANIVRGQEVEYQDGEITLSRRVGGLRQLPTNITDWHQSKCGCVGDNAANPTAIPHSHECSHWPRTLQTWTSYLPKTKTIEAAFNRLQTFEGTLWGALGRDQMRNPYEKAKKQFQACSRKGKTCEDPRLHFLSFDEMCCRLNNIIGYINSEPMEGEIFKGVPRINFDAAVTERPLFRLPEEMAYLYKRDWATGPKANPIRITSGYARVRLTHPISGERYSLFYTNPRVFANHEGEQIVVYYDAENFEQPAQIILARTGEYLCDAEYEDRKGSFLDGDASGHDVRKQWRNAVMSAYGTIVKHAPSRQLPEEIAARREEARSLKLGAGTIVDGRPTANSQLLTPRSSANPFAPATPEQLNKQQNRLARQAAHAARLTMIE